jgi:PAS domain-containing protein
MRVLRAKHVLEDRVEERTAELVNSNRALKREIDERISAEEALRASEEKHRLLAANINDVIWTMDLEMNYTYISPVVTKMHGWDAEEIESLTLDQIDRRIIDGNGDQSSDGSPRQG